METPNLILRKISQSNLQDFHDIWSNPLATKWSSCGPKKNIQESQEWLNGILHEKNPDGDNYAVFEKDSEEGKEEGRMLRIIGVFSTEPEAEVGYTFHPDFWGKGYATEALKAFMERYWAERPGVKVVVGKTDVRNGASGRVLEKAGFVKKEMLVGERDLPGFPGE